MQNLHTTTQSLINHDHHKWDEKLSAKVKHRELSEKCVRNVYVNQYATTIKIDNYKHKEEVTGDHVLCASSHIIIYKRVR